MMNDAMDDVVNALGFQALPDNAVALEFHQFEQAKQISNLVTGNAQQWQTYLSMLGLSGLEQWLHDYATTLTIDRSNCTVLQPAVANVLEAACNLKVGAFNLCVIAVESTIDEIIHLPRAVVDIPEYTAHFYVVVHILEDQDYAHIWGFLRYDQWLKHQQAKDLAAESNWTYQVPTYWFDQDLDHLLTHLCHLEPAAIALPEIPKNRLTQLLDKKPELVQRLPQVKTVQLWKALSWESGIVLLTNPQLLNWVYQLQSGASALPSLASVFQQISQPDETQPDVFNFAQWLQEGLNLVVEKWTWQLLPFVTPAPVFLESSAKELGSSPSEELNTILKQLGEGKIAIPPEARSRYQDLNLDRNLLRLYAVVWSPPDNALEWVLLLILTAQPGHQLPDDIRLRVTDQSGVFEQRLDSEVHEPRYLYARASGTNHEQFWVTLESKNSTLTLPKFVFHRDGK